jgi:hypothetical protein
MVPVLLATMANAWVGPLANLLAVPIVSVVVVPLDLVAGALVVRDRRRCGVAHLVDAPSASSSRTCTRSPDSIGRVGALRAMHPH